MKSKFGDFYCSKCGERDRNKFYPSTVKDYGERVLKGLKTWRPYCRSCKAEHQHEYLSRPEVKKREHEYSRKSRLKKLRKEE